MVRVVGARPLACAEAASASVARLMAASNKTARTVTLPIRKPPACVVLPIFPSFLRYGWLQNPNHTPPKKSTYRPNELLLDFLLPICIGTQSTLSSCYFSENAPYSR